MRERNHHSQLEYETLAIRIPFLSKPAGIVKTNPFPLNHKYCRFYSLLTPRLQDLGRGRILISRAKLDITHSALVVI